MNLDHIFLFSAYARGTLKRISAVRTDRKGRGVAGYATSVSSANDSEFPSRDIAVRDMSDCLGLGSNPVVVVSCNIDRDKKDYAKAFPFDDCIWLDIYQLAWPLVIHTSVSKERSFKELCTQFDISLIDTEEGAALAKLYWAMMTRYKTSLFGEELIRETGGKALASVRRMFGV